MPSIIGPSHLINPLASPAHLETSASQLDGVPKDLEDSIRYETTRLLQATGILLRLPQEIIAQSIVILSRFWAGADGTSLLDCDAKDAAAAALYLSAKPSATPISPRSLLTVLQYATSLSPAYEKAISDDSHLKTDWSLSEGAFESSHEQLYNTEAQILRVLGFQTHVALPHALCINYLQTLQVFKSPEGPALAKRAIKLLNTALLSPQQLYLTHQPPALATAAIYLAAREEEVNLPDVEWWEVFDVDREELGFLVVALTSVEGFAVQEKEIWGKRKVPLTVADTQAEMERRKMLEVGE
ncbi:hypothetical protein Q7P35_009222 [Cladosporium inversicolor]